MAEEEDLEEFGLFPNLPIRAIRCDPMSVSADCKQVCRCSDGSDYAIKSADDIPTMPHNEWLCAKLAERVGIPTPRPKIVEIGSTKSYGSRWEAGEEKDWWIAASAGRFPFSDIAGGISRIFAFDLFVHNGDRHLKNYFVVQQRLGRAVQAMDFGRAWLFNGFPLPNLPMDENENTIGDTKKMIKLFGDFIEVKETEDVCGNLRGVESWQIANFIDQHPKEWLPDADKDAILTWWESSERLTRIDQVEEGIRNGTFL